MTVRLRLLHRALRARLRDQRRELGALLRHVRAGDTVVDAGAHKGAWLYWLQRAVGPSGCVHAFEPQPVLAAYLRDVRQRLRWNAVEIHECALSDRTGESTLTVPGSGPSPGASLEQWDGPGQRVRCRTTTLDGELHGGPRIAAMKIDVEGHELPLLRGAAAILARDQPALLVECERRHMPPGRSMQDVFDFLHGLGYEGWFFTRRGPLPVESFDAGVHQRAIGPRFWDAPGYCNNFLWVRRGASTA